MALDLVRRACWACWFSWRRLVWLLAELTTTPAGDTICWGESWTYLAGTLALFVFCLLQIQVGLQERSPFLVNLGVIFIALDIIAAYCDLLGSMARTGLMFLIVRRVS